MEANVMPVSITPSWIVTYVVVANAGLFPFYYDESSEAHGE
jgi:hypothetical protein